MGELNLLDLINTVRDFSQKSKAKKYFASPDYQQQNQQFIDSGRMPAGMVGQTSNPYVASGLDQAIKARLAELSGGLTEAQTKGANANAMGTSARTSMDLSSFLQNGFRTPEAMNAATAERSAGHIIDMSRANQKYFQDRNLGPTPESAAATTAQETAGIHRLAQEQTGAHMANQDTIQALDAISKVMPLTDMKGNFADLLSAFSGADTGVLGTVMRRLGTSQEARIKAKQDQFKSLTGGAGTGSAPAAPPPGAVDNPYEDRAFQGVYQKLNSLSGRQTTPAPVNQAVSSAGMGLSFPRAQDAQNSSDVLGAVNAAAGEVRKLLQESSKLQGNDRGALNRKNQNAARINALAQPLFQVYEQFNRMGTKPPPDIEQLIQQLTTLGYRNAAAQQGVK